MCEAAYSGEEVPKGILDRIVRYLAVEIINLILMLNPQIVVIGEDAGIVGATFFAINSFLLNEFPYTVSRKMAIVG